MRTKPKSVHTALPVLENPFPMPQIYTAMVEKNPHEKLGISMSDNFVEEAAVAARSKADQIPHAVEITRVSDSSPLRSTLIQGGHNLLAIQHQPVHTSQMALEAIQRNAGNRNLQVTASEPLTTPFTRLVAATLTETSPGVSLATVQHRGVVQVSLVFRQSQFHGLVQEGDILLAVDGTPVTSPDQGYQLLCAARRRQYDRAQAQPFVLLYTLDAASWRRVLLQQVWEELVSGVRATPTLSAKKAVTAWRTAKLEHVVDPCSSAPAVRFVRDAHPAQTRLLVFAKDSWRLEEAPRLKPAGGAGGGESPAFDAMCFALCQEYNQEWNVRISALQEVVGCALWQHHEQDYQQETQQQRKVQQRVPPRSFSSMTTNSTVTSSTATIPIAATDEEAEGEELRREQSSSSSSSSHGSLLHCAEDIHIIPVENVTLVAD